MAHNFDFKQVGKRMPYTTPNDFFANMEEQVLRTVGEEDEREVGKSHIIKFKHKHVWPVFIWSAACVALLFMVTLGGRWHESEREDALVEVEEAFLQLSETDQAYFLDVNQSDVFLNY